MDRAFNVDDCLRRWCCSWEGFNYCDLAKHLLNNNLQIVLHLIKSTPPPPPPLQLRSRVQWRSTHPPTHTDFISFASAAAGSWWMDGWIVVEEEWSGTRNASCNIAEILFSTDPVMQPHSNFPSPPPTLLHLCGCAFWARERGCESLYSLLSARAEWEACIVCGKVGRYYVMPPTHQRATINSPIIVIIPREAVGGAFESR